jgi:LPXTG-site transpeptidase (sortase) family protein
MTIRERITIVAVTTATLAACAVFASTLVQASLFHPTEQEATPADLGIKPSGTVTAQNREAPLRLSIPAINVDAKVQSVGLGKSGNMAVPTNFTDVGWYRYGPAPGQAGSAVIDGHVDNGFGMDAVFKHINELKVGDDIFIQTADNPHMHFVVSDIETYAAQDVPTQTLFNGDGTPRLNLITCAGAWNADKKMYDERTVVYATLQ